MNQETGVHLEHECQVLKIHNRFHIKYLGPGVAKTVSCTNLGL